MVMPSRIGERSLDEPRSSAGWIRATKGESVSILKFFSRRWSLEGVPRPWAERESIHGFLLKHLERSTGRLDPKARVLPDEKPAVKGAISWMNGAMDGVFGHHMAAGDSSGASSIANAILAVLQGSTRESLAALHAAVGATQIVGHIDRVLELVIAQRPAADRLHALALLLCTEAPERELVKLGISLLGLFRGEEDVDLLTELGVSEELTLFSVVALKSKLGPNAERAIFDLARRTEGWGRISAVERLAETADPEIRAWMLREGFRNSVMDEYLAHVCATAGRLADALRGPVVDDELLDGASEILAAMARDGPAPGLADYREAPDALAAWIGHLESRPLTITRVAALDDVASFLRTRPSDVELCSRLDKRRNSDEALAVIHRDLSAEDSAIFGLAETAARRREFSTWEILVERIPKLPPDRAAYLLQELFAQADAVRVAAALDLARTKIDLDSVASGPAEDLVGGPSESNLYPVLQALPRFPGQGVDLIRASLKSRVIGVRNGAINVLFEWPRQTWTPLLEQAVATALKAEPDASVRERLANLKDAKAPGG
jgi:hypothetical protein